MTVLSIIGVALVLTGVLYLFNPNLFRRGFWKKTSIAIRLFSPEAYVTYMRIHGGLLVVIGTCLLAYGFFVRQP